MKSRTFSLVFIIALFFLASNASTQTLSGELKKDTTLTAELSPWEITDDVTIPDGVTLTIEPACTLYFHESAGIKVERGGTLKAIGNENARIQMTRRPDTDDRWNGIELDGTVEDNIIAYADILHGDRQSQVIDVHRSQVVLDHLTWDTQNRIVVEVYHPRAIIQNCIFPSVDEVEVVHGQYLEDDEYLILIGNTFGRPKGYNDVIDFTDCQLPGPILQVYNNVFLGGGDDGLDLDGTDTYIEGNIFMNFHKDHDGSSTSNAIATGRQNGKTSDIFVYRNIFYDNDHAVLLKEDCYMHAENNTIVKSDSGVINFSEWPYRMVDPGKGADLVGNIFVDYKRLFENQFAQPGKTDPTITVNHCLVDSSAFALGLNNIHADPMFVDATGDFNLRPGSPAIGMAANGLDMGAYVPSGVSISGEPADTTEEKTASLTIGGPGVVSYQYAVNEPNGVWSDEIILAEQSVIQLQDLKAGESYTVYVKGKNIVEKWQDDPDYATSKTWTIYDPTVNVSNASLELPQHHQLGDAYPNPFNSSTNIHFSLASSEHVKLTVYDAIGRFVQTVTNKNYPAGQHAIRIYAEKWPSGVYYYSIQAGDFSESRRFILLR
jgi:hypothetical protein